MLFTLVLQATPPQRHARRRDNRKVFWSATLNAVHYDIFICTYLILYDQSSLKYAHQLA